MLWNWLTVKVADKMVGAFSKTGPGFEREGGAATYNGTRLPQNS